MIHSVGNWLERQTSAPAAGVPGMPLKATENIQDISGSPVLLHGELDLWIIEAKALPNLDAKCLPMFSWKSKDNNNASGLIDTSDPYVSVCLAGASIARTAVILNDENPTWNEHLCVPVAHAVDKVEFIVKDNDRVGAELIGIVEIPANKIVEGDQINGWFPIRGSSGNPLDTGAQLHLSILYRPTAENPMYRNGVGNEADQKGVPHTYFPLRKGGSVTLYQDAHVPDETFPDILLDNEKVFNRNKCWEDICHAILEAQHLIYIVGWSVYHPVRLIREPTRPVPSAGWLELGELLKYKSEEGVRVILLIWDDKTSNDDLFLKTEGVMQTHDEETRKYFKHSSVHCVLCPRSASSKLSIFKQQVVGNIFTHHQKCVIVDTQAANNDRKITAFIGGLDLCDGRYDTPEHRLFSDLDTVFENDVHNPTFTSCSGGPREPWHDLHCKIEGPAAYDVLTNFEQRYRKAIKWIRIKKCKPGLDSLLKLDRIPSIHIPADGPDGDHVVRVTREEDPENWHVQVFRSIDSGSVKGFPKDVKEAGAQNLVSGKNLRIDRSIHLAYVKAIRSAQHFIYIENQYFLGSSYCWPCYRNAGANNLVPMEIALKIASKIAANEPFAAYIVVPMWPEGIPTSNAVQEILFWQGQTMAMMYKIVAQALENAGISQFFHPQDYLNFYCLGNREAKKRGGCDEDNPTPQEHSHELAQKFRRFMIYVHSKGMIADDEYVLMGSANINQRSLSGSRDSEIAMGAYQPHYTWAKKESHPHGQVYGYRMSLWAEHLGAVEDVFMDPQTIECVRRVNVIARRNWQAFVADEYRPMKGHLMQYPVQVSKNGEVTALPGFECFPDVGGKILGAPTNLPDALTT
ncbi:PREDICTED: phospholipase D delta-like [Nicotiana attenuata]|uniref:Phospholipase D n=1 Tax=Nicotiana attenuata TaxID=49451 RepID=A0A314L9C5_NICAT|nr:PREDICTED: phospholipase D delta-like [Nicotiana attenuata]OIT38185.1 phospholipase d delta [Nicotiana attenuata]